MNRYFDSMLDKNYLNLTVDEELNFIFINLATQKTIVLRNCLLVQMAFDNFEPGNYLISEKRGA